MGIPHRDQSMCQHHCKQQQRRSQWGKCNDGTLEIVFILLCLHLRKEAAIDTLQQACAIWYAGIGTLSNRGALAPRRPPAVQQGGPHELGAVQVGAPERECGTRRGSIEIRAPNVRDVLHEALEGDVLIITPQSASVTHKITRQEARKDTDS